MELLILFTIIRLVVPLTILRFPLFGILISIGIELYDWMFLNIQNQEQYDLYQQWDKVMDLYMFAIAWYVSLKWKDTVAKKVSTILFGLRAFGVIIFLVTGFQAILFFAPNVFETFFLFYLFFCKFTQNAVLFTSKKILATVLIVITLPKMIHEYLIHVMRKQPWELYSFGDALGTTGMVNDYIDYIGWGLVIHMMQILLLIWLVIQARKTHKKIST